MVTTYLLPLTHDFFKTYFYDVINGARQQMEFSPSFVVQKSRTSLQREDHQRKFTERNNFPAKLVKLISLFFFFFIHFGTFSNIYRNRTIVSIEMLNDPAIGSHVMMSYIVSSCLC